MFMHTYMYMYVCTCTCTCVCTYMYLSPLFSFLLSLLLLFLHSLLPSPFSHSFLASFPFFPTFPSSHLFARSLHPSPCCFVYLEGTETILLVYLVDRVVRVLLSVHCMTICGPYRYVVTSLFCHPFCFTAVGMLRLLVITVPVRVVLICSSAVAT